MCTIVIINIIYQQTALKASNTTESVSMSVEYVHDLLCKRIYEKPYAKANENTAMLEVIATVIQML